MSTEIVYLIVNILVWKFEFESSPKHQEPQVECISETNQSPNLLGKCFEEAHFMCRKNQNYKSYRWAWFL